MAVSGRCANSGQSNSNQLQCYPTLKLSLYMICKLSIVRLNVTLSTVGRNNKMLEWT